VRFFAWRDHHKVGEIADIEPLHVAAYVEAMQHGFEKPSAPRRHPHAVATTPRLRLRRAALLWFSWCSSAHRRL
jgi:hypothetical protein